jgi:purine-binding chemotaxis protein CheW
MASSNSTPNAINAPTSSARSSPSRNDLQQIIGFRVADEEFGLDILRVQEIIRLPQLTRVPNSADFVEGVINLRGKIIPVVSLRKRFGLREAPSDNQARIVVVEASEIVLGFVVDSVSQVLTISAGTIEPPPLLGKVECNYVSGVSKVGERLIIILDVDRLILATKDSLTTSGEPPAKAAITGRLS